MRNCVSKRHLSVGLLCHWKVDPFFTFLRRPRMKICRQYIHIRVQQRPVSIPAKRLSIFQILFSSRYICLMDVNIKIWGNVLIYLKQICELFASINGHSMMIWFSKLLHRIVADYGILQADFFMSRNVRMFIGLWWFALVWLWWYFWYIQK